MQKLFIISNESIYENNNGYFCDNIDLKSTPEGLNKKFEVNLIARKSSTERVFNINLKNIRRYCVAKTNINPGDLFSLDNVVFKRLGNEKKGIEAIDFHKIENTESSSLFKIGSIIKKDKSSE